MPCTKEQAHRGWVELQRAWKVLDALWEYHDVYRPRFPNDELTQFKVNRRCMGVFTHDEMAARFLYNSGIPVWLIRPISEFREQNILSVVELKTRSLCLEVPPHYTDLAAGHSDTLTKFLAIEFQSHKFCLHPDPFEQEANKHGNPPALSYSKDEQTSGSSRVESGGGRVRSSSHHYKPYPPRGSKAGKGGTLHFNYLLFWSLTYTSAQVPVRDKFSEYQGSFAPPPIPCWASANESILLTSRRERILQRGLRDAGYFFPDPGLFLGVNASWKAADYLRQWEHIKNVWKLRTFSASATPCSPQEWRDILSLGFMRDDELGKITASANALERVRSLIGDCLKAAGLVEHSLSRPPPPVVIDTQVVDIRRARVLLWELCELNFRWELRALDSRLYNKGYFTPLQRHQMLMDCFPHKYNSLMSAHPSLARSGMAFPSFADRLPYIQALWRLMTGWPGPKPSSFFIVPHAHAVSPNAERWERDLVRYYAQTFFDNFFRPPILPHTLGIEDISFVL
jgi:hypothetical protein